MALSFSEKRGLQKTVATNLAGLAAGGVAFQEKRRMQKEISDAIVRLGEKAPAQQNYAEWEAAVIRSVEDKLEVPTSDAQGIVEGQAFAVQQAWGQGLDPATTADKVIEASKPDNKENSAFTDNSMQEIVAAVVADGGDITGKNLPAEVFFLIYGGVSAKVTGITSEGTGAVAGFVAKNIDTGEESSIMQTAEQAMVWLRGTFKDDVGPIENQKLTDLLSGKYNDEKPEVFIKLVKDVIDEIKEIDPVKPALLSYIEAAKAKGIISESAIKALESILES